MSSNLTLSATFEIPRIARFESSVSLLSLRSFAHSDASRFKLLRSLPRSRLTLSAIFRDPFTPHL